MLHHVLFEREIDDEGSPVARDAGLSHPALCPAPPARHPVGLLDTPASTCHAGPRSLTP